MWLRVRPDVYEEAKEQTEDDFVIKQYGRLTVLLTRINQDLMLGGQPPEEDRRRQPLHGLWGTGH